MLIVFAGALLASQNVAAPVIPHWSVTINFAHCLLKRQTVQPTDMFVVDTVPGSDSYSVLITNKFLNESWPLPGSIVFAPSNKQLAGRVGIVRVPQKFSVTTMDSVGPLLLENLSEAESITLKIRSKAKGTVSVPNSAKAVAALRGCIAEQLEEWGADAAQFAPGGKMPVALLDRSRWISNEDLLAIYYRTRQRLTEWLFRVSVTADGTTDDCQPVSDDVDPFVIKVACNAVASRRLFLPATNPVGKPVRGVATFRVFLTF